MKTNELDNNALEINVIDKVMYVHLDYVGTCSIRDMSVEEKLEGIKSGKYHICGMSMKLPHLNPVKILVKEGIRFHMDAQSLPNKDGSRTVKTNKLKLMDGLHNWGSSFDEIIALDYTVLD